MFGSLRVRLLAVSVLLAACGGSSDSSPGAATGSVSGASGNAGAAGSSDSGGSAGASGAAPVAGAAGAAGEPGAAGAGGKSLGTCATDAQFGTAMPPGFIRVDGTLAAIVRPVDKTCAAPNGTHVTLQLLVAGKVYRMVVNVESTLAGDKRVRFAKHDDVLAPPAWGEGFHEGVQFDYPISLGLHTTSAEFAPMESAALIDELVASLTVGQKLSVYSQGTGGTSTHKVHRNGAQDDGAIVVDPAGTKPKYLLFHFAEQSF